MKTKMQILRKTKKIVNKKNVENVVVPRSKNIIRQYMSHSFKKKRNPKFYEKTKKIEKYKIAICIQW